MPRLAVFCGSSPGNRIEYKDAARRLGQLLAEQDIGLVYGGSHMGLMGNIADACLAWGGEVIGVMPGFMAGREIAHRGLTKLHLVETMHERKAMMADLSDAFVALPGGFGTWDEFCEIVTWSQIGLHQKPFALLNVEGFYDAFVAMADHAAKEGFLRPQQRQMMRTFEDVETLLSTFFPKLPFPTMVE